MRMLRNTVLAGVAAIGLAGFSGAAAAHGPQIHVLTVPLPGGGVEEIHYTGDIPPQVTIAPGWASPSALAPLPAMFGPDSPFAMMQRISAAMDRQAAAMLRQAEALADAPSAALSEAALRNLPPGTQSYSFFSSVNGNRVCSRSVAITTPANGGRPHVVTRSSGSCGAPETGAAALPPAPAPTKRPDMLWTRYQGTRPYAGMVREANWRR